MSPSTDADADADADAPTVSVVFLVFNRCEELRTSLDEMLGGIDFDPARLEVIVVDNASQDGSAEMVAFEFPGVRLIRRTVNCGVSGWNDGFAVARGEWVLALDDDCYLPGDGLRRGLEAAGQHHADLVSFGVAAGDDPDFRFNEEYRTGLLSFWGCAVLLHRRVLEALGGYDPEIFVYANELEFTLRAFDAGFRHLHLPEVVAVHMKTSKDTGELRDYVISRAYPINARHYAYVAAKLLHRRDAAETLVALVATVLRDAVRTDRAALRGLGTTARGFARGLRRRAPVKQAVISRTYRENFESFASPWWLSRPLPELVRSVPRETLRSARGLPRREDPGVGRRTAYYERRARYHPSTAQTLDFASPAR